MWDSFSRSCFVRMVVVVVEASTTAPPRDGVSELPAPHSGHTHESLPRGIVEQPLLAPHGELGPRPRDRNRHAHLCAQSAIEETLQRVQDAVECFCIVDHDGNVLRFKNLTEERAGFIGESLQKLTALAQHAVRDLDPTVREELEL
jgi:hypothetical protein